MRGVVGSLKSMNTEIVGSFGVYGSSFSLRWWILRGIDVT
ncbi:hypothetical protein HMPREF9056_02797 [Actinomyces sp. oral taxon 170 str. F0386]|nr:hypothetical protein HMPREF9056_02797 [Actinomyces sp. oral taxon 170 str. F0386]